ncbi:MAG: DUF2183 domain-containing protein [Planctomycetota bacterium]|mgnify:CR=1 FL=1|nr:MAG: DUF2183 domain-containing protein [Planctomycetota bacterium]REJ93845.1 MAG: DUF2183 domain-containing protein [Planctomycetota bacterium]REK17767.1 MAG: DUF2183 domain-containing protein [Planctomycetota bacterium]REK42216.1 MAG: DUF2183 domain-containing protein [Planctomycetota bacterium]
MSKIEQDQRVVFFPTYGHRQAGPGSTSAADWLIDIHGVIFRPLISSRKRDLLVRMARSWLPRNDNTIEQKTFRRRFWAFLVDHVVGQTVSIRIGDHYFDVGPSNADGHFRGTVRLPAKAVDRAIATASRSVRGDLSAEDRWLDYEAVMPDGCRRRSRGRIALLASEGLSVVSDVDDTIKISGVSQKKQLLANVLARSYRAVPGMSDVYRRWAEQGAAFHYVSACPWQLYLPLSRFCGRAGYPAATYHLKKFRLREPTTLGLFKASKKLKVATISKILSDFPRRRFLLVGDTTQKDPEVYGELLRDYDAQITQALIRNVPGVKKRAGRLEAAFRAVDADRWHLFDDAEEIGRRLTEMAQLV